MEAFGGREQGEKNGVIGKVGKLLLETMAVVPCEYYIKGGIKTWVLVDELNKFSG